jgi:hypothetical protein
MPSIQQVAHTSQNGTYQSYSVIEKWDCDGLQLFEIASFGICNSLLSRFASTEAKISKVESRGAVIEVCNTKFCLHLCYLYLNLCVAFTILCLQSFQISCNPLRAETGTRSLVQEKSSHLACTKEQDAFAHGTQQLILRDPYLIVVWHVCKKYQDLCSIGETYHIRLSRYLHLPSFMTVHSI